MISIIQFRIKDINVFGSILSNLNLPHEEFDLDVTKILTRKQTNETKNNKDKFTIMKKESDFGSSSVNVGRFI